MGKHAGPAFVNRADNQAMAQPFALDGTTMRGFLLRCDEDALQAQLDRFPNVPSGGAVRYTVLAPVALLYFADFARTYSEAAPDDKKGWLPEKDCGIWIPAVRDDDGGKKIALSPLYMFVDSGHACVSGREVYGFPKEMARLQVDASPFRCSPVIFETFSPDTEGGTAELIRVSQETERGLGERLKELGALAFDAVAALGLDLMHLLKPLFDRVQSGGIPFVFLRQLRSVADPDVAAYQAICEADVPLDNLTEVKLLSGDWTIQIRQADSHPLVEDLGLSGNKIQPALAFEVGMDFQFSTGKEIWRVDPEKLHRKQKITVLGGGLGAMGAVWGITNQPDWRDHYDITVSQMGWRLGGKGASGRNPDRHQRIEEHGLHVFLGFYENVFPAMRKVYAELGRPPSKPLATFETEFAKFSDIGIPVMVDGKWEFFTIPFPEWDELPGIPSEEDPGLPTSMHDLLTRLVDRLLMVASNASQEHDLPDDQGGRELSGILGGLEKLAKALLGVVEGVVEFLGKRVIDLAEDGLEVLARALLELVQDLYPLIRDNGTLQVISTGLELGLAIVVGFFADDLIDNGFDSIDDEDFRDWLVRHGANRHLTDATLVMAWYDLAFAFEEGDLGKPRFAAGACLRAILRTCLDYRGAIFWKMQAGMGDTVFGPFYEVLKRRGVKFRFFSKVERIEVADAPDDPTQLECT